MSTSTIAKKFKKIEDDLVEKLNLNLNFEAEYIFNPLEYATEPHKQYVTKYCKKTKKVLFLGENPGKWGMAQTGVPFGDVTMVRDWLQISNTNDITGNVEKNEKYTEFSVTGFNCKKSEQSGLRLWSLFEDIIGKQKFVENCFVYNYCPFLFLDEDENNITPQNMTYRRTPDKRQLEQHCDESLKEIIKLLKIETVVGIGRYAETRAKKVMKDHQLKNVKVVYLKHPSPRAGTAPEWREAARNTIREHLPWLIPAENL